MFPSQSSIICSDYCGYYTLCLSNKNTVYSFGKNEFGCHGHKESLIFPPKEIKGLINIKSISCGNFFSICLNYDGICFTFGKNDKGQLGIDTTKLKKTHKPQKLNLPPIKQVSCGSYFSICLSEDNILYSFGNNSYGQLGREISTQTFLPQQILDIDNVELVSCGANHVICKTYDNMYYSWGQNSYGQISHNEDIIKCNKPMKCTNWPEYIIDIKCGRSHSLLLSIDGHCYTFGRNNYGQLGINDLSISNLYIPTLIEDLPEIQRIECGYEHCMCIDVDHNLWQFGDNFYAQMGTGERGSKSVHIKPIIHPTLSDIIDISSKGYHTFIKTSDNKIYSCGHNEYSQIGIKTTERYQLIPIQVFNDNEDIWLTNLRKSRAKSARK